MKSVSIITTVYNGSSTIADCIRSVDSQSASDVEHVIVDGCSEDNTLEIVGKYSSLSRRCISERDSGIYDGMNKGIKLATGEIIGILNADDFYANSDVIQNVQDVFQQYDIDACYGDLCYVHPSEVGKIIRYWRSGEYDPHKFYWGWMPPHPTFFVKKRIYDKYGCFNLDFGSAADYELMLRFLVRHGVRAKYIPKVLVKMRAGGASNASFKSRIEANKMDREAWRENQLQPYPWTTTLKPLRKIGQWFFKKGE